MLKFSLFLIVLEKLQQSKDKLKQMIALSVERFGRDIKIFAETGIKFPSLVLLESVQDVLKLTVMDVHQKEQNTRAMKSFLRRFDRLTEEEQIQLINSLSVPLNGKGHIENNNEIKLILIYQNHKNSYVGQEAYNKVILNKDGLFRSVAQEKVIKHQLTPEQAKDYVQEMYATLCGSGYYNSVNGGAYSLDAFDPYSGVPFNSFVKEKVIPSSYNKFLATYNTSVSNDLVGTKEGAAVVSTDETTTGDDSDDKDMTILDGIKDESEYGQDPSEALDKKEKLELLERALTGVGVPHKYHLTDNEIKVFNELNFKSKSLEELGKELGYKDYPVPNVKRIQDSALRKIRLAIEYLSRNKQAQTPSEEI